MGNPVLQNGFTGSDEPHPALRAWGQASGWSCSPHKVEELNSRRAKKENPKSRVFRLHEALGKNKPLIAKLAKRETASLEERIYREILIKLPLRFPKLYGSLISDTEKKGWLFFEDAGELSYDWENEQHVQLAIEFIAELHFESQQIDDVSSLPESGPVRYLCHLESALRGLQNCKTNTELSNQGYELLDKLEQYCLSMFSSWLRIEQVCGSFPKTLVHGDFNSKNVRIRGQSIPELLLFDWEMAGFGMPGPDLSAVSMWGVPDLVRKYHSQAREAWPHLSEDDFFLMEHVGSLFRLIAAIDWDCMSLSTNFSEKVFSHLEIYFMQLKHSAARLQWIFN